MCMRISVHCFIAERYMPSILSDRLLLSLPSLFRSSEGVISPDRHVRTRLYFTSESHVHSVVNILKYGGLFEVHCVWFILVVQCLYLVQIHVHVCRAKGRESEERM